MAENKTTITAFLTRVLVCFSIVMLFLLVVGPILGDDAQGVSTLFQLGTQGIPYIVVLQALVLSLFTNIIRELFLSNFFFKKTMMLWRTIFMFSSVLIGCGILSILFGWFPANQPGAWLAYILCFGVATGLSSLVMVLKTRYENALVNLKLEEYKKQKQAKDTTEKEL